MKKLIMKMELLFLIITSIILIISFSILKPCTSSNSQQIIQSQNSIFPHHAAAPDYQLPRKIRFLEQMTTRTTSTTIFKPSTIGTHDDDDDQPLDSDSYHQGRKELIKGQFVEHVRPRVRVETWKEWAERENDVVVDSTSSSSSSSDDDDVILTMDYSRVTRRRPIHNKSLPVGP